ncbi:hypothetical protein FB567DRAFT_516495 [Paraphoma chrysanthemicola]|uniref:Uncharacterized protein n=1 Tax=Paraphoma chrysanthemicola TaxID=798071 RepID=A0A8K0RF82_9PLEO|nr:hypothetical protein FB567DRAFT_516495 [Paraphoma chrysanthemicola]
MDCTRPQPMRSFGGMGMDTLIIDASPCSTAPLSPLLEDDKAGSYIDCEPCISTQRRNDNTSQEISCVQSMIDAVITNDSKAAPDGSQASEHALITYLHNYAVTLPEAEALISILCKNIDIMNRLATNIGFFYARGCISSHDLEQLLIHIFTHDDAQSSLFQLTTSRIEHFRIEEARSSLSNLTPKQKQRHQQHEDLLRQRQINKTTRAARHRWQEFPPAHRETASSAFLPLGCCSIADIYSDLDGMSWTQVRGIEQVNAAARNIKPPRKRKKAIRATKVQAKEACVKILKEDSFWAMTRLHNGPGLEDKRRAKVRLPQRQSDIMGIVLGMRVDGGTTEGSGEEYEMVVASRTMEEELFAREEGARVLICVPIH